VAVVKQIDKQDDRLVAKAPPAVEAAVRHRPYRCMRCDETTGGEDREQTGAHAAAALKGWTIGREVRGVRTVHRRGPAVVVLGQEEAYVVKADAIGTEHLLLGLLDEGDELVAEALKGAGFPERAERLSRAYPPTVRTVHIPFAREAVGALHRSQEESAALGEAQVRPGHLLLALLRGDDASSPRGGGAIKMLQEQGWTWYRCGTE
jgi:hypothetical protein